MQNLEDITTLAIDTSCDETSVSVVSGRQILANELPSQMEYHSKFGGVVPSLAKLAHSERINNVVDQALKRSGVSMDQIDLIAVTYGPGLAIALEIGLKKAKELAVRYKKPLIAINHMEGHLLSSLAVPNSKKSSKSYIPKFPALGFLISGGHTELILVRDFGSYLKLGETLDDSCGEAYDKCGRILGFGYPAGPVISKIAKENRKNFELKTVKDNLSTKAICTNKSTGEVFELPVAMARSGDLNFSYSGLKTAFKQLVEGLSGNKLTHQKEVQGESSLSKEQIVAFCVLFEAAAIEQLKIKLAKALKENQIEQVWLGGGVIASARLRSELRKVAKAFGADLLYPYTKKLTGDNAAMIALAANYKIAKIGLTNLAHDPVSGIWLKDFEKLDRDPSLTF
ncbi:tRNA N6-adenosine threonylcarbamoyltransferase [Candidatus Brocadiaceae bacterium]|nr:tRNA N6-adenosine threonylcarbamoyltransferase [Candidatus Brocadiaceae bacterium]